MATAIRTIGGTTVAGTDRMVALHAWIPDDRPRERLAAAGPTGLGDGELLAILLGGGSAGRNAVEVANALLARVGDLRGLCEATERELRREPGVGPARAGLIRA